MTTLQEAMVKAKVLGKSEVVDRGSHAEGDEFLSLDELVPIGKDAAKRSLKRILAEVEELVREKKWEDMVALFRPVEEKAPELLEHGLDTALRAKVPCRMIFGVNHFVTRCQSPFI
ncbi:MAG: hypothetical protein GY846_26940 [Deltaproteobacteria bacterium]|nr:hypothetical protein [Deltaproteobacteria bacterium]